MVPPQEFHYVVERKPPALICFGTKKTRNTAPIGKDLSPFQRMTAPETSEIEPGHYATEKLNNAMDKLMNKVRSVKGVGPLASSDLRFKDKIFTRTPSPTRYIGASCWGSKEKCRAPFGTKSKRMVLKDNKLPGPGTYNVNLKKCRRTRFMYNFGHPTMISSIEMVCVSRPIDTCIKCNQICAGDYWHKDHITYLCHLCYEEEKRAHETFPEKELVIFQKIRNCSFTHRHEGTTAAIRILPPKKVNKKLRIENYLDLYIKC